MHLETGRVLDGGLDLGLGLDGVEGHPELVDRVALLGHGGPRLGVLREDSGDAGGEVLLHLEAEALVAVHVQEVELVGLQREDARDVHADAAGALARQQQHLVARLQVAHRDFVLLRAQVRRFRAEHGLPHLDDVRHHGAADAVPDVLRDGAVQLEVRVLCLEFVRFILAFFQLQLLDHLFEPSVVLLQAVVQLVSQVSARLDLSPHPFHLVQILNHYIYSYEIIDKLLFRNFSVASKEELLRRECALCYEIRSSDFSNIWCLRSFNGVDMHCALIDTLRS